MDSPDGIEMQVVKLLLLSRCHRLRSSTGQSSGDWDLVMAEASLVFLLHRLE